MSDRDAVQAITMVAARAVDVNLWLFVGSKDQLANAEAQAKIWNHEIQFCAENANAPKVCGAIFVAENDHTISQHAAGLLHYFFERDGAEATIFEFDKFEHDYKIRRWDQIHARTR